jgi:hypothetical protein
MVLDKEDEMVQMLWDITDTQDKWDKMKDTVNKAILKKFHEIKVPKDSSMVK